MIDLLLAIASSAAVSIFMRVSEDRVSGNISMLVSNYIVCALMAVVFVGPKALLVPAEGLGRTVWMGVLCGMLYLVSFVLLQWNVGKNGVVLSSIFMKLGLLVPMVVSIAFFGEMPAPLQVLGFLLAVGAIVLINMETGHGKVAFKAGLILLLLAGGSGDAMSKVFEELGSRDQSNHFLLCTFGTSLVLCTALMLRKKQRIGGRELLFGTLVGIPNYFSASFLLRSLETVPAVIAYPTFSVGTIVVVTLAGVGLFGERLGRRQWVAVATILVALVLLNI